VHDFDAIRWVTGREVVEAYVAGSNKGAEYFADAADVDTAAALLTLDDGTLVVVSNTRYNSPGAPISWGVCEVPGWGYQLRPDRVLREMREVGLTATELGPDGFLPSDPSAMANVLSGHGLQAVGGFSPLLLHVPEHDPVPEVNGILDGYIATAARVLVLSAATGAGGYDARPQLDGGGWQTLLSNLDRLAVVAAKRGVLAVLHPHVGTMIENGEEVQQVLDGSSISLCLDTGHLLIGGSDPAVLARQAPERIAHVHLKDVDSTMPANVRAGRLTYSEAVRHGMYRPLGTGDVDVAAIVGHLRAHGYDGWYTFEQDTILTAEPHGEGPVADVWTSTEHLRAVLSRT
jgi:inosose dehydratase